MNDVLSIASLSVGVAGLIFGFFEHRRTKKVKALMREQYMVLLNRVKYRMPTKEIIRSYIIENKIKADSSLIDHLWTNYQGISDLYVNMVGFYLNNEERFTYQDLNKMIDNKFVNSHWQEKIWRNLISTRKENKNTNAPDFFLPPGTKNLDYEDPNGNKICQSKSDI